jgi:hypothetical protein
LNPNSATDGNLFTLSTEGYTNLEVYLNSLVSNITDNQNVGGVYTGLEVPQTVDQSVFMVSYDAGDWSVRSSQPMRRLEAYNLFGRQVFSAQTNLETAWNGSTGRLVPGIYLLRTLLGNGTVHTQKVQVTD